MYPETTEEKLSLENLTEAPSLIAGQDRAETGARARQARQQTGSGEPPSGGGTRKPRERRSRRLRSEKPGTRLPPSHAGAGACDSGSFTA
jgi:hypothetical protein